MSPLEELDMAEQALLASVQDTTKWAAIHCIRRAREGLKQAAQTVCTCKYAVLGHERHCPLYGLRSYAK